MKIVFIAGWGRSGTTVLDRLLGEMPEYASIGELRDVADGMPLRSHRCSCGSVLPDCPLWGAIIPGAMQSVGVDERRLHELRSSTSRQRHLFRLGLAHRRRQSPGAVPGYLRFLFTVYESVVARSGRPAVVDSSKSPSDALLLAAHPDVDLHVIHLVRDPRGPAYSWSRPKPDPGKGGASTSVIHPATSSRKWLETNAAIELFLRPALGERYQLVRYEDLTREPSLELRRIARRLGSDPGMLPFGGEREVSLRPGHTLGGNPMRFCHGPLVLAPDLRWVQEMRPADRRAATVPALPLLGRYGYSAFGPPAGERRAPAGASTVPPADFGTGVRGLRTPGTVPSEGSSLPAWQAEGAGNLSAGAGDREELTV